MPGNNVADGTRGMTQAKSLEWEFPSTRYQGSKRKLLPWIYAATKNLNFESALDLFGGSGVVSYLLKKMGKSVTYNDYLKFNYYIGTALIENSCVTLSGDDIEFLLESNESRCKTFVEDTFKGMYYTDQENQWIDRLVGNILRLRERYADSTHQYKRALAYYALFQSCLVKRPFNIFHRNNLYLRMADVPRSFGNKSTWDTPFEVLFRRFTDEINGRVFSNGKYRENCAINQDAFEIENVDYDLVYIDPPYFSRMRPYTACDYSQMYHFLEGLANYGDWHDLIDYSSPILHLKDGNSGWPKKSELATKFDQLFRRFANSIIVVSYKSPGIPTEEELICLLGKYKRNVSVQRLPYWYALSKLNGEPGQNIELLLIGQ